MICPYNRKSEINMQHFTQNFENEDAPECVTSGQTVTKVNFELMECPKEGCAVWRDGKCCFAAAAND